MYCIIVCKIVAIVLLVLSFTGRGGALPPIRWELRCAQELI